MLKKVIIIALICCLVFSVGSARIRHVPAEYPTIQDGINDCSGGDTLLVEPGTYYENLNFNGQYWLLNWSLPVTRTILTRP